MIFFDYLFIQIVVYSLQTIPSDRNLFLYKCLIILKFILEIYLNNWNWKKGVRVMVFNATFNNISAISWWSVLLVQETEVSGENHRPAESYWQTLSHNVVSSIPHHERFQTRIFSSDIICSDCTCSCKSNHHTITTTTTPKSKEYNYEHFNSRHQKCITVVLKSYLTSFVMYNVLFLSIRNRC